MASFFMRSKQLHEITMRSLNELINSGKTLTKREREAVERHIEAHSERISLTEINDIKITAAIKKRSKYAAYG